MPTNGGEARSHIANVIDQTTRIFREGNKLLSRGSAIKYVDKFGEESGVEYCRTWTKDRPYISYSKLEMVSLIKSKMVSCFTAEKFIVVSFVVIMHVELLQPVLMVFSDMLVKPVD